jgi:hypothetical protein
LLEIHIDPGELTEFIGKGAPMVNGVPAPSGIAGKSGALALEPDEAEVATRSPVRHIALVEQGHWATGLGNTICDGGTHQPSADNDCFI